jgi:rhodanese-related sulfurtransferase
MSLKDLFRPIQNMTADEVRQFIDTHQAGSFTLLDVRQPSEYEGERIPGSLMIPLPELQDRLTELDPTKPVITY